MDQFAQMITMLSSFWGPRQETTKTPFCNYLASDLEALQDGDIQTFRNEAVKLLSGIQSRPEERTRQPQQPTLSRSYSSTSTFLPQQPAQAGGKYILTLPDTKVLASQIIQPV